MAEANIAEVKVVAILARAFFQFSKLLLSEQFTSINALFDIAQDIFNARER
jgi:hypothetical protein